MPPPGATVRLMLPLGATEGGCLMEVVTVSPKFQVVIPRSIRDTMDIQPGQKVQVVRRGDHIEIIPVRPVQEARGFLRGLDTTIEREQDRS
jgi:AbrB family looped-hinge helix DNA binding protein